jgi:hypothetical protein
MLCSGIKPQAVNNQIGRTYAITPDSKQPFPAFQRKAVRMAYFPHLVIARSEATKQSTSRDDGACGWIASPTFVRVAMTDETVPF